MVPRLLIITGTSGVGKSTLASKLASSLNFGKVAATDTIREVLRTQFNHSERPALHRSSFESAGGTAAEDWIESVDAVSEGLEAVIGRAMRKGTDLLMEGVHIAPGKLVIDSWREAGGLAAGIVLFVEDEAVHEEMIANREKHNGKRVEHYLGNMGRIRSIQEEMLRIGSDSDWIMIDQTADSEGAATIERMLRD